MADQFAAPPINALISITPLSTPAPGRDATAVPSQLAGVTPGTLVEGFVVNRDNGGNPILRTILGDVLVKTDVFIKTGSEVVFRVDTTQAGHARILTIDGLPPENYVAANSRGMNADTIAPTQLTENAPAAAQAGTAARLAPAPLTALLVNNTPLPAASIASNPLLAAVASEAAPVPQALLKLQQGTQLQVKLLQVTLPPAGETTPAPQTSPVKSAPALPPPAQGRTDASQGMANANVARLAMGTVPLPAESLAVLMQAGIPVDSLPNIMNQAATLAAAKAQVKEETLPLPGETKHAATPQQQQAITPRQAGTPAAPVQKPVTGGVPAYIIGHEKDGAAILQTPVGTLKMYLPTPLPVGTGLRLQIDRAPAPMAQTAVTPAEPDGHSGITNLAQDWPALEESLGMFPPSHEITRAIAQSLPEIGPKLTSGLLFFIAAVKGGDVRQMLGQRTLSLLESRVPALAARLKQDMAQLQGLLTDSPLKQWSSAMVPMLYQGQLEHARLFFRDDSEGGKQTKKTGGDQRFIVEVDLSHLGEMQFDGFVRSGAKAKTFDLFVRSSGRLTPDLMEQIRGTFDTAMQTSGIKGFLSFQQGSQHFVRPMAEPRRADDASGAQPILA